MCLGIRGIAESPYLDHICIFDRRAVEFSAESECFALYFRAVTDIRTVRDVVCVPVFCSLDGS